MRLLDGIAVLVFIVVGSVSAFIASSEYTDKQIAKLAGAAKNLDTMPVTEFLNDSRETYFRAGASWALLHSPPQSITNLGQHLDWLWQQSVNAEQERKAKEARR